MKYQSKVQARGAVTFPEFTGERIYMLPFYQRDGLPTEHRRWQETVDAMLAGIETDLPVYLMVDQGVVLPGNAHRRPGVHVDGYWNPEIRSHGFGGGHGYTPPARHVSYPTHGPSEPVRTPRQAPKTAPAKRTQGLPEDHPFGPGGRPRTDPFRHPHRKIDLSGWQHATFDSPEGIILASNIAACRAMVGTFVGPIAEGGDCSALDLSGLDEIRMDANRVYAGNVTCLHESLPVETECQRTLVRLNVPGWTV